jgi:hypothetical protein
MSTLEELQRSLDELKEMIGAQATEPAPVVNVTPAHTQGVEDGATVGPSRTLMSQGDIYAMREMLKQKSTPELHAMFAMQSAKKSGVPLEGWLAGYGPRMAAYEQMHAGGVTPEIQRLLDTSGGAALIRQDLEPILYELYIREFPAWDRMPKEPANGLVHTYQQLTSFGGAEFMGELGVVTDDASTYVRQTTNIAIVATRRGVSIKNQFAALQSGSGFNPLNLELQGGLRAIAKKMQDQLFSGHSADSGGLATNELGLYDANAFTGLRAILNTSRAINVDPATNPDTTGSLRRALADAATQIMQQGGGAPSVIWASPLDIDTFSEQQESKQRWPGPAMNLTPGTVVDGVMTAFGRLPFGPVPGTSIDSYTYAGATAGGVASGNTVRDMYLVDESSVSLPYLGSEGPTVLDIPTGVGGQLTHLYIIFGMWGFAVKAIPFSNKVRIKG